MLITCSSFIAYQLATHTGCSVFCLEFAPEKLIQRSKLLLTHMLRPAVLFVTAMKFPKNKNKNAGNLWILLFLALHMCVWIMDC